MGEGTLPFEFAVAGRPVSHQTNNRANLGRWRDTVRAAAAARWGEHPPVALPLRIVLVYCHEGETARIDGDNLLKPIQDALIGLVYDDDQWVTDVAVRKTPIDGAIEPRWQSPVLLLAYSAGDEFVHVRVEVAPPHETPLR